MDVLTQNERKKHLKDKYMYWLKRDGIIPELIVRQFKKDVEALEKKSHLKKIAQSSYQF